MTTTRFFAVVGVAWTLICAVGLWYVWQDEEIPDDGGAVAAAWGLSFLVVAAWLVAIALMAVVVFLARESARR